MTYLFCFVDSFIILRAFFFSVQLYFFFIVEISRIYFILLILICALMMFHLFFNKVVHSFINTKVAKVEIPLFIFSFKSINICMIAI